MLFLFVFIFKTNFMENFKRISFSSFFFWFSVISHFKKAEGQCVNSQ